jgi:hypothetical protein
VRSNLLILFIYCLGGILFLASPSLAAEAPTVQLKPDLFSANVIPTAENELKEVHMQSGLGFAMHNPILNLSLDYKLKGSMRNEPDQNRNSDFSQVLATTLQSSFLNRLLDINASIKADQVIRDGGDIYKIQLAPSIRKKLTDQASLDVKYSYVLDKPSATAHARETRNYLLGVKGKLTGMPGGNDDNSINYTANYTVNYSVNYGNEQSSDSSGHVVKTQDYLLDLKGKLHRGKLQWNGTYKTSDSSQTPASTQHRQSIDFKNPIRDQLRVRIRVGQRHQASTAT